MPIADEKEYRDRFLKCPFCLMALPEVERMTTPFGNDIDAGKCQCGAAYIYDYHGKNLGDFFMDAIAMAFDWDYDAYNNPEMHYEETMVRRHSNGKYLLGDGGKYNKDPKFIFVRRSEAPSE